MSYSIRVDVVDGKATVTSEFAAPNGIYLVNGHSDEQYESINVARYSPDNQKLFIQSTAHVTKK